MAGYGTDIEVPAEFDPLVRALLRAAQRRAQAVKLEMRYRHRGTRAAWTTWSVVVNGNGVRIAAWVHQIERELPIVAEGYIGTNSTALARRVAGSFVARFINWFMADDEDEVESNRVVTSRPDPVRYLWPVLDIPEQDHRLGPRLWIAEDAIARWMTGDLPEEIVIEEVHTAAEAALRFLLGADKAEKWPALLKQALQDGLLDAEAATTLGEFTTRYRNRLKHRAEAIAEEDREAVRETLRKTIGHLDDLLFRQLR